jgi:nucleotide-binding universal stress UspA family protein
MAGRARGLRILVADDGSAPAAAAVRLGAQGPWPETSRVAVVVAADPGGALEWSGVALDAIEEQARAVAHRAEARLRPRWPAARARVVVGTPTQTILAQARSGRADLVILGSRGHGMLGRVFLGSVSHAVARHAPCSVLVAKRPAPFARLLLAVDGSANAGRAIALLARLPAPAGGRLRVVQVVEPARLPSMALLPARVRESLSAQARRLQAEALARAERVVGAAARAVRRAGWPVETAVVTGAPAPALVEAARTGRWDGIVVGARGVTGLERLLLGSVAEGVLAHAPCSVLIVR